MRSHTHLFITALVLALLAASASCCPSPTLGGCKIFPDDDEWNRPIDTDPVDYNSDCLVAQQMSDHSIHLDLGVTEQNYGIPYTITSNSDPLAIISYGSPDYSDESDSGPVRVQFSTVKIEGGTQANPNPSSGDRHVLLLNQDTCQLYETFNTARTNNGLQCSSSAAFDLTKHNAGQRPDTWTSADAAGLPILPGLLKFSEANSGTISHALRFTLPKAQRAFQHPATHYGPNSNNLYPIYGQRFRLKASFSETPYSGAALAVVRAFKKYGLVFADQGSAMYVSGTTDPGWESVLQQLHKDHPIDGSDFEAVQAPSYFPPNRGWSPTTSQLTCGNAHQNAQPFTPVYQGNCVWSASATATSSSTAAGTTSTAAGTTSTAPGATTTAAGTTSTAATTTTTDQTSSASSVFLSSLSVLLFVSCYLQ